MLLKKIVATSLLCIGVAACDPAADTANVGQGGCTPLDYRNGVFYFPCVESDFANSLSRFVAERPSLRTVTMTGNGNGGHGRDNGYFVLTEQR